MESGRYSVLCTSGNGQTRRSEGDGMEVKRAQNWAAGDVEMLPGWLVQVACNPLGGSLTNKCPLADCGNTGQSSPSHGCVRCT